MKYYKQKTLGRQGAHLITTLYEQGKSFFRLRDVADITGLSSVSARSFARKLVDRGLATRLKSGLFLLVPLELGKEHTYLGNLFVVARELVQGKDYYLSHATAMEIHNMKTQPQLTVVLTTTKMRRPLITHGVRFQFVYAQSRQFFGFVEHWATQQEKVRVSDLERTILDGLKQPEYCGGITEVAKGVWMRRSDVDIEKLIRYATRIGVGAVLRRLGFLLETYEMASGQALESLQHHLTRTYVRMDPVLPPTGPYLARWRLQLNVTQEELLGLGRT